MNDKNVFHQFIEKFLVVVKEMIGFPYFIFYLINFMMPINIFI